MALLLQRCSGFSELTALDTVCSLCLPCVSCSSRG